MLVGVSAQLPVSFGIVGGAPMSGSVFSPGWRVGCASAYVTIPAILHNAADTSFERVLERVAAGDIAAQGALDDAGYALGVIVAQLMNVIDPEKVIVTGEGLAVARAGMSAMDIVLAERLDPASERSEIEVRDFSFADYAWAAAVSAIRRVV